MHEGMDVCAPVRVDIIYLRIKVIQYVFSMEKTQFKHVKGVFQFIEVLAS